MEYCSYCKQEFISIGALKTHIREMRLANNEIHIVGNYKCLICNWGFESLKSLHSHIWQQTNTDHVDYVKKIENQIVTEYNNNLKLDQLCQKFSLSNATICKIIRESTQATIPCPICGIKYVSQNNLNNHISSLRDQSHIDFMNKNLDILRKELISNKSVAQIKKDNLDIYFSEGWIAKQIEKLLTIDEYKQRLDKIKDKQRGSNGRWYRHGKNYRVCQDRGSDWGEICRRVRIRDDNECQNCFKTGKQLNLEKSWLVVHHKIPYRVNRDNSLNNLITLCNKCHSKIEKSLLIEYPLDKYPPTYIDNRVCRVFRWTAELDKILKDNHNLTDGELVNLLKSTTKFGISSRRRNLGLLKEIPGKNFTEEEIYFIKENYGKISVKDIAQRLNRGLYTLNWKIGNLGLNLKSSQIKARRGYNFEDDKVLLENKTLSNRDLSLKLNKTISSIITRKVRLKKKGLL